MAGIMLAGDAVGASGWAWRLVIRPWASTGSSMRNRCAPRIDTMNTTRFGRVLVTDTRRSCPAPASMALIAAGGRLARTVGAKWARSAAAGIGSLPSAWKNHRPWAPAGVPGNADPEPADGAGLPPHPASTTMTPTATRADRRHPAVLDRSRPVVFAGAGSAITVALAPSPGAASLASLIRPSPSDEAHRAGPHSGGAVQGLYRTALPGGTHITSGRSLTDRQAAPLI